MSKIDDIQDEIRATPGLRNRMIKYGAVGAVSAIPIPFVGPVLGGIAGAALAYSKRHKP